CRPSVPPAGRALAAIQLQLGLVSAGRGRPGRPEHATVLPLHPAKLLFLHAWHDSGNDRNTTPETTTPRHALCRWFSPSVAAAALGRGDGSAEQLGDILRDGGRCGEAGRLDADQVDEAGQAAIGLVPNDEVALHLAGTEDAWTDASPLGRDVGRFEPGEIAV